MTDPQFPLTCEYAYGEPRLHGVLRARPADFFVSEALGFEPSGTGEHDYLLIEKSGLNTAQLARQLAELAGIRPMDVGYAGLKDRHAVTRQWFSLYRPKGDAPDWSQLNSDQVEVLQVGRHTQKLRRGAHAANHFRLRLTACEGDFSSLEPRLAQIAAQGVPNYFGLQRFGYEGGNLAAAQSLLVNKKRVKNRQLRGLYLSAARAYLFNQILRARVLAGTWRTLEPGDVADEATESLPTGPLWGRGRLATGGEVLQLEQRLAEDFPDWCHGLEHAGLKQARRPLCLPVNQLSWSLNGERDNTYTFAVAFTLPVGGYATSVVRELVAWTEPERGRRADHS